MFMSICGTVLTSETMCTYAVLQTAFGEAARRYGDWILRIIDAFKRG